ncbi:MAG: hypothetical protein VX589_19140 [Myxococcota bacterium]|nr:hypothetical protein [Myxococcota bacterium]
MENAPLAVIGTSAAGGLVGLGVWAAAVTTDALTGAAYQCPNRIRILDIGTAQPQQYCPSYFVVEPTEVHLRYRPALKERYVQSVKDSIGCARLVDAGQASTWRRQLDVGLSNPRSFERNRRRFHRLGFESGASHIVQLTIADHPTDMGLRVRVLDLHRLKIVADKTYGLPEHIDSDAPEDG